MNLRHIDPRSTDWMDAMLEGDLEEGRRGKRAPNPEPLEAEPGLLSVGESQQPAQATRPPPGQR